MVASAFTWHAAPTGSALQQLSEADRLALVGCFTLVRLAVEREIIEPAGPDDSPPQRAAVCARLTWMQVALANPAAARALAREIQVLGEAEFERRLDPTDGLVARFARVDQRAVAWLTTPEALSRWVLELAALDVALLLLLWAADADDADAKALVRRGVDELLDEVERMLDGPAPSRPAPLEVPSPAEFVALAHAAFTERAELAHGVAELARRWWPDDPTVVAARRLFAPPVARAVPRCSDPAARARNRAWLQVHEKDHPSQWLVLANGMLLGSGDDLDRLVAELGGFPPGATLVRSGA